MLADGRVQIAGDVADLLAAHHRITGRPGSPHPLPEGAELIHAEQTRGESSMIVRCPGPVPGGEPVDLEDMTLAYLTRASMTGAHR